MYLPTANPNHVKSNAGLHHILLFAIVLCLVYLLGAAVFEVSRRLQQYFVNPVRATAKSLGYALFRMSWLCLLLVSGIGGALHAFKPKSGLLRCIN